MSLNTTVESTNASTAAAATGSGSPPERPSASQAPSGRPRGRSGPSRVKERPPQEVIKTWAFDSVGNRKYALQIRKASNGNPCLKIVEGVPQPDGTFRKFELTFWSEDWPRLFETIDTMRAFAAENNIKTPDGHKFDPNKKPKWKKK